MNNNDLITVGLDFGTHQTKICIKRTPDEGHGEPIYEFFGFKNQNGKQEYALPSMIHIKSDHTLEYGFVDLTFQKMSQKFCPKVVNERPRSLDIPKLTEKLYKKYATNADSHKDQKYLKEMLLVYQTKLIEKSKKAKKQYEKEYADYMKSTKVFRYFKQATFAEREWVNDYDSKMLSIWYLSYILFLLEERFGDAFSINMGIPAGDNNFEGKRRLAVEIICSAYNLVENVYQSKELFLKATVEELMEKTEYKHYSEELKYEYNIQIFPEAYASLIYYTSQKKLGASGINLTVDIGGGTTDISFFTIQQDSPVIYRYWSINRGLNYLAELSGFGYMDGNFSKSVKPTVIKDYNQKKKEIVAMLYSALSNQLKNTNIPKSALSQAFHTIVYSGGGSMYNPLIEGVFPFKDSRVISQNIWEEEHMKDKAKVMPLCKVLTTAYGLSMCNDDNEIVLGNIADIFQNVERKEERHLVTKECC